MGFSVFDILDRWSEQDQQVLDAWIMRSTSDGANKFASFVEGGFKPDHKGGWGRAPCSFRSGIIEQRSSES